MKSAEEYQMILYAAQLLIKILTPSVLMCGNLHFSFMNYDKHIKNLFFAFSIDTKKITITTTKKQ